MESFLGHKSRRAVGGFVTAVLLASVLSVAAVSAQTSATSECSGDFVSEIEGIQLLVGSVTTADVALASAIPAGSYDLNAASRDEHDGRDSIDAQLQEQWVVEFLDANGAVLATSQATADLQDNTPSATWSGSIGSISLAADAVSARLVHAAPTSSTANSVFPVCFGAVSTGTGEPEPGDGDPVLPIEEPDDVDVPADPVTSSIILDFDSDADATSSAGVICDISAQIDTGDQIDLIVDGIEPGTECIVAFPQNLDCSSVVDPESTIAGARQGDLTIALPADVAATVLVDIDCTDEAVASATLPADTVPPANNVPAAPVVTTTAPPAAVDATTAPPAAVTTTTAAPAAAVTTTTVASQVASTQNAPAAPAAQPRVGTPAFTG